MIPIFDQLDLTSADQVCAVLNEAAAANRSARCRRNSIDEIAAPGTLIATGDLHDNPLHLGKLVLAAGLGDPSVPPKAHLTLHEIIHSDRLLNGMDFSYRVLVRVAALKSVFPEHVHTLLANHELAQLVNASITKNGVRCTQAFNDAVEYAFRTRADEVTAAIGAFIRSMPLAMRVHTPRGDILCSHSLPDVAAMSRFDPSVIFRDLNEKDYEPRVGSAYLMLWGRGYDHDQLEDLVERWGVSMFILGHEHVDNGVHFEPPNAIVLNSDHENGVYLPIDLSDPPKPEEAAFYAVRLAN